MFTAIVQGVTVPGKKKHHCDDVRLMDNIDVRLKKGVKAQLEKQKDAKHRRQEEIAQELREAFTRADGTSPLSDDDCTKLARVCADYPRAFDALIDGDVRQARSLFRADDLLGAVAIVSKLMPAMAHA